jgi:hypothetical protein
MSLFLFLFLFLFVEVQLSYIILNLSFLSLFVWHKIYIMGGLFSSPESKPGSGERGDRLIGGPLGWQRVQRPADGGGPTSTQPNSIFDIHGTWEKIGYFTIAVTQVKALQEKIPKISTGFSCNSALSKCLNQSRTTLFTWSTISSQTFKVTIAINSGTLTPTGHMGQDKKCSHDQKCSEQSGHEVPRAP